MPVGDRLARRLADTGLLKPRSHSAPRPAEPRPEPAAEEGEARKPRRRKAPRSFEGGEGEAPAAPEKEEV